MARNFFIFFLVLVAVSAAMAQGGPNRKMCGPNEEWTECGTACPPTCEKPTSQICTLQCVIGCKCKEGLLRNSNGECVEPSEC